MAKALADKTIKYVHGAMMDWFGVDLTDEQIIEIGKSDLDVWKDLLVDEFDTVTRENFGQALTRYVMGSGSHWPRYGEGKAVFDTFMTRFEKAARTRGIKLLR